MTGRRWTSVAIASTLGLAVVGSGLGWRFSTARRDGQQSVGSATSVKSPMLTLAEGLHQGDQLALKALCERVLAKSDEPRTAIGEQEGADLVEVLQGLRVGFLKFEPVGRSSAVAVASRLLDRFGVEPAPNSWLDALHPVHDLYLAGLADASADVRAVALTEIGHRWGWLPGRTMTPFEEKTLADWKFSVYRPAVRRLSDLEPKSRMAAVVCIGSLPIDSMASAALANLEYPDSAPVRYQTLMTFANRPALLSVDAVLKRLHDPELGVRELAQIILKGRGLTKEQIFLGRQMFDPRPEIRASLIPLLKQRTDIDTDVWMLQLSHDADETVRTKSVEALVDRDTPEVDQRLREMAASDTSASVRAAAGKHVSRSVDETTAALPPLPGSTRLNPKAN